MRRTTRVPRPRTPTTPSPRPELGRALAALFLALPLHGCAPSPEPIRPLLGPLVVPARGSVPAQPEPEPPPDLRAATYNILAAKRGIDGLVDTLAAMEADVIALQEVDVNTRRFERVDLPSELGRRLGMHHAFVRHRRYQGGEIGVALLSRTPIHNVKREAAPRSGLAMLTADVQSASGTLHVIVVHTHPTDPRDPPKRRTRLDALRLAETTAAAELASGKQRVLVMGDFNATPKGPEYDAMESVLQDACPRGGPTWPASLPVLQLDYIWTSRDMLALDCRTPASAASDHRPRLVDLRFAEG